MRTLIAQRTDGLGWSFCREQTDGESARTWELRVPPQEMTEPRWTSAFLRDTSQGRHHPGRDSDFLSAALSSFIHAFAHSLICQLFTEHRLYILQTVGSVGHLVPTLFAVQWVRQTDSGPEIAHKANELKLISHNCDKGFEEDILGALTSRRAQSRWREIYKTV